MHSKLPTLDFRRADFGFFMDLLSRVAWDKPWREEGPEKLDNIQGLLPPNSEAMHPNKEKSGKNAGRSVWVNKGLLDKLKQKKEGRSKGR